MLVDTMHLRVPSGAGSKILACTTDQHSEPACRLWYPAYSGVVSGSQRGKESKREWGGTWGEIWGLRPLYGCLISKTSNLCGFCCSSFPFELGLSDDSQMSSASQSAPQALPNALPDNPWYTVDGWTVTGLSTALGCMEGPLNHLQVLCRVLSVAL